MTILDPKGAGQDAYISEDPQLTGEGKFYQVIVPNWGPYDDKNSPDFAAQELADALNEPVQPPAANWPPYAYYYGGTNNDVYMSSMIRLGRVETKVTDWSLPTDDSLPAKVSDDDYDGLLTGAAMLRVLDAKKLPDFINFCGHREHTDGNRIVTTYGHHINVVNGDYHNITLAHLKWEHDHPEDFFNQDLDPGGEEHGVANHYLCCDLYYDVMSTWFFPGDNHGGAGERPLPYNGEFTRGNANDKRGSTYDSINHNLIPDYYEYINAENLRSTYCTTKGDIEKTFAGKHIYLVCTNYGDGGHTHNEQYDFSDWSDGDLWEISCAKNYRDEVKATGDIKEKVSAGGDITSDESATAFLETRLAKAGIDGFTLAGAEIADLTLAAGGTFEMTMAGLGNVDVKLAGGANVDIAAAGAAAIDVTTAGGVILEMSAAIGAKISLEATLFSYSKSIAAKEISETKERLDTCDAETKKINTSLGTYVTKTSLTEEVMRVEGNVNEMATKVTQIQSNIKKCCKKYKIV